MEKGVTVHDEHTFCVPLECLGFFLVFLEHVRSIPMRLGLLKLGKKYMTSICQLFQ